MILSVCGVCVKYVWCACVSVCVFVCVGVCGVCECVRVVCVCGA